MISDRHWHGRGRKLFGQSRRPQGDQNPTQYEAWLDNVIRANWRNPEDVKTAYPKASILKAGRVVFNIKGNDYRLVAVVGYRAGALAIRYFGSHAQYDGIDAETV